MNKQIMPVILATQEAEIRKIMVQGQAGKKFKGACWWA
jgi:hypothetical protein